MAKPRVIYKMQVTEIVDHTPSVRELVLRAYEPGQFEFRAGQFVMLHVPQEPKPALRAYSIASDDRQKNGFRLLFKHVDGGLASHFVWHLRGGEILNFTGPFGRVFFQEPPPKQIIFLNTGTGISQHICYLLSKGDLYPDVRYRLLFGVRSEHEIYYREPLEQLAQILPDFKYEYVLSRPQESWQGKRGYVQNFLSDFDYKAIDTTFYMCGNGQMIKDVKKRLIEDEGLPPQRIFSEAFD